MSLLTPFIAIFEGSDGLKRQLTTGQPKKTLKYVEIGVSKKKKRIFFYSKKKKGKVDSYSCSMHGRTPKKFCVKDRTFHVAYFLGRASGGGSFRLGSAE